MALRFNGRLYAIPFLLIVGSSRSLAESDFQVTFSDGSRKQVEQHAQNHEDVTFSPIEELLDNPIVNRGLETGTVAINRSIESLMEGVFYSLMDQTFRFELKDNLWLAAGINRRLFSTGLGTYVVVDGLKIGPQVFRDLSSVHGIPSEVGGNSPVKLYSIYAQSDVRRIAEESKLPWWRVALNKWFGLLPILTRILPPSFNPNEMYDPAREVIDPFLFPDSIDRAKGLPLGQIRSSVLSGGVYLSSDFFLKTYNKYLKNIEKFTSWELETPISIFVDGDFRVNVLRKSENEFWVGLTKLGRAGLAFDGSLGTATNLFANVIPYWSGVPAAFFPVDVDLSFLRSVRYDHLFTFDLSQPSSHLPFLDAVRGNFSRAFDATCKTKDVSKCPIKFKFWKRRLATESESSKANRLFFIRKSEKATGSHAQVEIRDEKGSYFVLQAKQKMVNESWNAMSGGVKQEIKARVDLFVDPVEKNGKKDFVFSDSEKPLELSFRLSVQDQYADTLDFKKYIGLVRKFVVLDLSTLPKFPIYDRVKLESEWDNYRFHSPDIQHRRVHTAPQILGRFQALARIHLNWLQWQNILKQSRDKWREAFCLAFRARSSCWEDSFVSKFLHTLVFGVTYPLKWVQVQFDSIEVERFVSDSTEALTMLKKSHVPSVMVKRFLELFDQSFPVEFVHALLSLVDQTKVPREVTFFTKAKGGLSDRFFKPFVKLNRKTIASRVAFPKPDRHDVAKELQGAFVPQELREKGSSLRLVKVHIETLTEAIMSKTLQFQVDFLKNDKPIFNNLNLNVYIKLEQVGSLSFGKLVLAEEVIELMSHNGRFFLPLNGNRSQFANFFTDQALVIGGAFRMTLAVSEDAMLWSKRQEVIFTLKDMNASPFEME